MTVREISDRFDYLLKKSSGGIVVDEYIKSLYLTESQASFVDLALSEYERTDVLRHILEGLLVEVTETTPASIDGEFYIYDTKDDMKSIIYEYINEEVETIPLDFNDIHKTRPNPFRKPYGSLAYRLTNTSKLTVYSQVNVTKYFYIYCKEADPIVLEDIPVELAINGVNVATTSVLPYDTILKIIQRAVSDVIKTEGVFRPQEQPAEKKK